MSDPKPNRVGGLEAHEVDDGLVVYQAATDRVHYLNPVASVVFELCTGEHTETEIVEIVGAAWGLADPPHDEVHLALTQFRAEGILPQA
jgi:hypothetical protein